VSNTYRAYPLHPSYPINVNRLGDHQQSLRFISQTLDTTTYCTIVLADTLRV
jgi:hypothetical protein